MVPPPPEPQVVARARRGDAAAFEALVRHYQDRVHALAWRLTYDDHLARDVTQDVFLRLYEQLDRYDPARGAFEPWFLRLATNLALNARARAQVRRAASLDAPPPGEDVARGPPADPGAAPAPERAADAGARAGGRAAGRGGAARDRGRVVVLHYLEGLGLKEIAARLDMPEGTVKVRLFRARALLREKLARFG
ncbi:MAG: sigma-70 family RNA polymerase sigma factor [Planctomycetes bacterium]|nr:sigma-70 family RNA polymerase sigma factor [Planctomycetota bacterium]